MNGRLSHGVSGANSLWSFYDCEKTEQLTPITIQNEPFGSSAVAVSQSHGTILECMCVPVEEGFWHGVSGANSVCCLQENHYKHTHTHAHRLLPTTFAFKAPRGTHPCPE